MSRVGRFVALPRGRQCLLVQTVLLVVVVRVALRLVAYGRVRRFLGVVSWSPGQDVDGSVTDVAWATRVAVRHVPGESSCLARALVARVLCSRSGLSTTLKIGVIREPSVDGTALQAHGWLEHDGEIIVGDEVDCSQYTVLETDR